MDAANGQPIPYIASSQHHRSAGLLSHHIRALCIARLKPERTDCLTTRQLASRERPISDEAGHFRGAEGASSRFLSSTRRRQVDPTIHILRQTKYEGKVLGGSSASLASSTQPKWRQG
jgi:hypothetical protein